MRPRKSACPGTSGMTGTWLAPLASTTAREAKARPRSVVVSQPDAPGTMRPARGYGSTRMKPNMPSWKCGRTPHITR